MTRQLRTVTATIPINDSVSQDLLIGGRLTAIVTAAAWTAAALSLEASVDGVTWYPVAVNAATQAAILSSAAAAYASSYQQLSAVLPEAYEFIYLRLRSGTTAAPVTQVAARVLILVVMPFRA